MYFKIVTFCLTFLITLTSCSVVPAVPSLRYTLVAPPNQLPFAAQVSTFTKGLNVLHAPLAAGVLNPPAIYTRTVPAPGAPFGLPAPVPAHLGVAPVAPVAATAPLGLAPPAHLGVAPLPVGVAPAPLAPWPLGIASAPHLGIAHSPVGVAPAPLAPVPFGIASAPHLGIAPAAIPSPIVPGPAHVLPFPNARSIHSAAPPAPVIETGVW